MPMLSTSQINKLGERLRKGLPTEPDLRLLDEYRKSFEPAYFEVRRTLSDAGCDVTGRLKITESIVNKLHRERTRLSRIQDIGGCRLITQDIFEQNLLVTGPLLSLFPGAMIDDRRINPSH